MAAFLDACRFNPTTGGTTDWTFLSAVTGYQSPTAANVVNGRRYKYRAESTDLSQWELGEGIYNAGVLSRATVLFNSSGNTSKINFSAAPQVAIVALKGDMISIEEANSFTAAQKAQAQSNIGVREVLSANRTYYVRVDGSDSNSGLADNAGGAFLTPLKAMNTIAALDCSVYDVTVIVRAGAYGALTLKTCLGSGTVYFVGDVATPSNVILSAPVRAIDTQAIGGMPFDISGFRAQGSGGQDVGVVSPCTVTVRNMEYNGSSANYRLYANGPGAKLIAAGNNHHVRTGGIGLLLAEQFGTIDTSNSTFTFDANVTYTGATAGARFTGILNVIGQTFTLGAFTVTGTRYSVATCGGIIGTGGSATFFPGNAAGSAVAPGYYS